MIENVKIYDKRVYAEVIHKLVYDRVKGVYSCTCPRNAKEGKICRHIRALKKLLKEEEII